VSSTEVCYILHAFEEINRAPDPARARRAEPAESHYRRSTVRQRPANRSRSRKPGDRNAREEIVLLMQGIDGRSEAVEPVLSAARDHACMTG